MTTPDLTFVQRPQGVAPPLGAYSHLAIVPGGARLLVLAGQTGHAPDGSLSADAGEQWVQALRNVLAILASQDAGPEHLVKMNTWVVAGHDVAPATTFAYVPALFLPELLVEIEVWAALS